jgi:hypothetical protein
MEPKIHFRPLNCIRLTLIHFAPLRAVFLRSVLVLFPINALLPQVFPSLQVSWQILYARFFLTSVLHTEPVSSSYTL